MNKTLSVNIGGIVFHIEELAYEKLSKYLDTIKGYFTSSDGRDEIMQDIEARLGEMFQERISGGKQVIVEQDVEHVINVMGKPEQFAEAAESSEPETNTGGPGMRTERGYRRLYRDSDDRIIGGVCSGFAHYLGVDPIWIRLAFAVAFFAFGSGVLLYIILMLIMPKASTTAEKLEMKGEKVNISNIKRSVEEELESMKSHYESSGTKSSISRFFDAVGQVLAGIFRLFGKLIAAAFIFVGFFILIGFVMMLFALLGIGSVTVPFFMTGIVLEPWQQSFAVIGGFLMIGIPLIMIIYAAVRVLFKVKSTTKVVNWTAFALWIVGVGMSITVGTSIAGNFKMHATSRSELNIVQPVSDTLQIGMINDTESRYSWYLDDDHDLRMPWAINESEDTIRIDNVRLDIVKAQGTEFELLQLTSSRGMDRNDAYNNAEAVIYRFNQTENRIDFDEFYMLPFGAKFRAQRIQLVLKVPEGKSIYLAPEIGDLIYDIKNVTNTYDGYMVGHTWTMTPDGLECIGCDLPGDNRRRKKDKFNIRIDDRGVRVNGVDGDSDTTFTLDGDDVNIKIDGNGVKIESKE